MKKFLSLLFVCCAANVLAANIERIELSNEPMTKASAAQSETWGEWTALGTATTDASNKQQIINNINNYTVRGYDAWSDPVSVDQRVSSSDASKVQYRLNNIFNGKDIILDYDVKSMQLSAQKQSTGYEINTQALAGYGELYSEFMFVTNSSCYYFPHQGKFALYGFFSINERYGLSINLVLQLDNVNTPKFSYTLEKPYVGRNETEATINLNFEAPIVKYRMLMLTPSQSISLKDVEALYPANPVSSFAYEELDSKQLKITCTEMGSYRVVLIPIGENGNAILPYFLPTIASYVEPAYEWTYIGESKVDEYFGSVMIPNEIQYQPVGDQYTNKYPWMASVEGVKTYRRADNPNIIGLCNMYDRKHPYSSMFRYVDESQDWWMYIDTSNPEDVKLITTPSGVKTDSYGYAAFFTHCTYDGMPKATYSDNVIIFPPYTILIGMNMNQDYTNASFDLHVQLPTEKAPDAIQSVDSQEAEAEYFNLQGLRINEPVAEGFYIERRGNKLIKHFVK